MYGGISAGKAGQPQPMFGYSKDKGSGMGYHHNGNSNMYYPQYDYSKPEKTADIAVNQAIKTFFATSGVAGSYFEKTMQHSELRMDLLTVPI